MLSSSYLQARLWTPYAAKPSSAPKQLESPFLSSTSVIILKYYQLIKWFLKARNGPQAFRVIYSIMLTHFKS